MANTDDAARDIGALTEEEYAGLMIRVVLGTLYVGHPVLMWSIFGLDHASHYFASVALPPSMAYVLAAGELLGGVLLFSGLYVRQAAIGLLPIAIGAAVVHFGAGLGAGVSYGAYLACCLAGQALLASGVLARSRMSTITIELDLPPSAHAGH